jgi:hypothetical protein
MDIRYSGGRGRKRGKGGERIDELLSKPARLQWLING